ncbi:MAG: thiol reductant ABC exporter subunit CydD [Moraxella sp.]|nr:thiol reductant ABC exporter subunit CydD [Moraxella sp.]
MSHPMPNASSPTESSPKKSPTPKKPRHSPEEARAIDFLKSVTAPYKKKMYQAWGLDVLSVGVLVGQMALLAQIFSKLLTAEFTGVLSPEFAKSVLWASLPYLILCLILRMGLSLVRDKWLFSLGVSLAGEVRHSALAALAAHGVTKSRFGQDGAIASLIGHEPDALVGYVRFYVQKLTAVSTPFIILLAVASQNVISAVILFLTAPLVPIFMAIIGRATAKKSREQMDAMARLSGRFLDWLRGVNTLVRLLAVGVAARDIEMAATDYQKRTMSVLKVAFLNGAVLEFLSALSIALVAVYLGFGLMGVLPWASGTVISSYFSALFILLLVPEFYAPLRRLGAEYHAKATATAAATALAPFIDSAKKNPATASTLSDFGVSLADVSVVGDDGRVRLSPVSLTVNAGQRVAVLGQSGAGKSTLLSVLLGFSAYQGVARIGGFEIKDLDAQSLHSHIGYLPQTPALLPLSIAENLRLAKPAARDDELNLVLEKVGLLPLISALPNGINTRLSERGGGLSGGQAQRLALAQLLLQDAKIWLLDEPTEHLDEETKVAMAALIEQLSRGKTLFWVTHDEPATWLEGVYRLESSFGGGA